MFNPETPPELTVSRWFNSKEPITLASLKGRVVVLTAFQLLCPGCVEHGLPQAKRLRQRFNPEQVAVIGLHTVFEHHKAMTEEVLEAFLHEYRWPFPVGVDTPNGKALPKTMAAYEMQGTPTLLLFDRAGQVAAALLRQAGRHHAGGRDHGHGDRGHWRTARAGGRHREEAGADAGQSRARSPS